MCDIIGRNGGISRWFVYFEKAIESGYSACFSW